MAKVRCGACGYQWVPRVENPKKCPSCGFRGPFDGSDRAAFRKILKACGLDNPNLEPVVYSFGADKKCVVFLEEGSAKPRILRRVV